MAVSEAVLSTASEFIAEKVGLYFPKDRWKDLERGLCSAAQEFDFEDAESYIKWLMSCRLSKSQIETLAGHITVGETYFFREKRHFEILEEELLPKLIYSRQRADRHFRFWSAGCCSGEELYSMAILLHKMLPALQDWSITLLGTDINPLVIKKASTGIYHERSFRGSPSWNIKRFFKRLDNGYYEILPGIRKMVAFSYLNLAEDSYPLLLNNTNAMDVIFCCNVLMYFKTEQARKVIHNLYHCLVDGGWLIVSPCEASADLFKEFAAVSYPGAVFYHKSPKRVRRPEIFPKRFPSPERAKVPMQTPADSVSRPEPAQTHHGGSKDAVLAETHPTLYDEAVILYNQGRYAETSEKLSALLSKNRNDLKAMTLMARTCANHGQFDKSIEWCGRAIAADKLNPGHYYLLANIQQETGLTGEAVQTLKKVLYLEPDFVLAYFALGNLALREKKYKETHHYFSTALSLLRAVPPEDVLPESGGMTAGRLVQIIAATNKSWDRRSRER